jgi:hypothetical protein
MTLCAVSHAAADSKVEAEAEAERARGTDNDNAVNDPRSQRVLEEGLRLHEVSPPVSEGLLALPWDGKGRLEPRLVT